MLQDMFLVLVGLVDMATSTLMEQGESVLQRLIRALKAFRSFRMIRVPAWWHFTNSVPNHPRDYVCVWPAWSR